MPARIAIAVQLCNQLCIASVHGSHKDKSSASGSSGEVALRNIHRLRQSQAIKHRVLFQAAAGVILTGVGYYSLFKADTKSPTVAEATDSQTQPIREEGRQDTLSALDREAQNTTNKVWGVHKS